MRPAPAAASPATAWHLYVVRTGSGALYTGIATDVARRLAEHAGGTRGAKALRARGPLTLVYAVALGERSLALRAEARFKRLTKPGKEALVGTAPEAAALLGALRLEGDPRQR